MKPNETQLNQVKKHLRKYRSITSWEAIRRYRITRLSEYIRILRHDYGACIVSERQSKGKKWWVKYKLL